MTELALYPPIEPYATHRITVGDGHELYVEEVGRPDGVPAVFLHGGPGGGLVPAARRFFDPDRYRVVLFDQRGAGRSTPFGGLRANTTWHLVDDLEVIRARLGIDSWLVFGGSWGVTLGLAYAQAHPDRVTGLILRGVLLMRRSERDWFYQGGLRHLQPDEWDRFIAPIPPAERDDVLAAYHRRLHGPDEAEARACAAAWGRWEAVNSSLRPDPGLLAHFTDERQALPIARILSHYGVHGGFLGDTQLLDGVDRIRHLPAVIINGRYDLCCPPASAYDLAQAWPEAELRMVPDAGHSAAEPGIARELLRATDHFADLLTR
ncbi:prolyl aminopeptidase [Micromonospora sp. NPDC048999]|uniref:prolyl aminopeptidase n=1 Tax=Micromonospora sp. NPDC048999 TaxID=3155391 RepID=UPI0033E96A7C